jgi:hypothetical protein
VDDPSRDEQKITRPHALPDPIVDELAAALHDNIGFIAGVRLLRVGAARGEDLDNEAAALKHPGVALALGPRQPGQRFGEPDSSPLNGRLAENLFQALRLLERLI